MITQAQKNLCVTRTELFLKMAMEHPAKFTNPEEVAWEWQGRIACGEIIPYVSQYLRAITDLPLFT